MSGVNIDLFKPEKSNDFEKQKDEKFIVMYHGVIAERRALSETIEAMAMVHKSLPNICFFILGHGLIRDNLLALVEKLNLKSTVQLHDKVSYNDIPGYIEKADVGIIPLPDEPCWQVSSPLKLFEYMAMAKPVIVSSIEAHVSVLKDCPAVVFLKSSSPTDIASGIIQAYENRDQLRHLAMENRNRVVKQYTWQRQALELEKFINSL